MAKRLALATTGAALLWLAGPMEVARAERETALVIHLEDYVGLQAKQLKAMQREVDKIFRASGVTLSWAAPLRRPMEASREGSSRVAVSIVNVPPPIERGAPDSPDILGRAAPAHRRAWVFFNLIADHIRDQSVDVNLVLARVMAHEVGHLLLPAGWHSASGLMRRSIELTQLGFYRFTPDESRMIRAALARHPYPAAGPCSRAGSAPGHQGR